MQIIWMISLFHFDYKIKKMKVLGVYGLFIFAIISVHLTFNYAQDTNTPSTPPATDPNTTNSTVVAVTNPNAICSNLTS